VPQVLQSEGYTYPPVRELLIAQAMAHEVVGGTTVNRGIVGSLSPIQVFVGSPLGQVATEPEFAYNPGFGTLISRLEGVLGATDGGAQ
jgi:hypothetical protein